MTTDGRSPRSKGTRVRSRKEINAEIERRSSKGTFDFQNTVSIDMDSLIDQGVHVTGEDAQGLRDEMRRIKWPVLDNAFGGQQDMLPNGHLAMVTSATSGEGKTFTSINLAMSIASEREVGVLLVDADIAKPHVSKVFGLSEKPGVIDYLAGEVNDLSDVIVGTSISGLSLLPAGRADAHASELIASSRMEDMMSSLDEMMPGSIILFDTSPLLQTNESQVLSRMVGQVVLVVAANRAPQPAVQEAVSLLDQDLVVNVVFNRVESLFSQKHRYGGYYGYQSRR